MSYKKEVIAQMRDAVKRGIQPTSGTLTAWANVLEQPGQQTLPMATVEPCDGKSGVQPAAHIERVARRAWDDFCRFRDVGGRISAVAKFPGYAVRISIKEVTD